MSVFVTGPGQVIVSETPWTVGVGMVMVSSAGGPQGDPDVLAASAEVFSVRFDQRRAAAAWPVAHMLGRKPSRLAVTDSAGTRIDAFEVEHLDADHLVLHFPGPFSGTVQIG